MKRAGFTMIELIFVIVILGILAAVAIPKLAATRDDAKVAKGAMDVATAVSDFGTFYTAQGYFSRAEEMSNMKFDDMVSDFNTTISIYYEVTAGIPCIEFNTTVAASNDGNFTVSYEGTDTTAVCKGIADAVNKLTGGSTAGGPGVTHSFGGEHANFD